MNPDPQTTQKCDCGRPSKHSVGKKEVCCECYVRAGNAPADWHPVCMNTYKAVSAQVEMTKLAAPQFEPMLYSTDDPEGKMARLKPRTWLPIDTAPKDGTWFIATWGTGGNRGYRLAAWSRYYREFVEVPRHRRIPFEMWTPLPEAP